MKLPPRLPLLARLSACLPLLLLSISLPAQSQPQPQSQQGPPPPPAPLTGPGLIVTYLETPPAKASALTAVLASYAAQLESGPGKPAVTVLKELARPNRIVVLEQWPDLSSPSFAEAEALLAAKAQPYVLAPIDRRVNHPLAPALANPLARLSSAPFIMAMHVDIRGGAGDVPKMLAAQRDAVLAAPGALGYEVAVQDQRTNHFTMCELWASRAAYEAYTATAPAEDLRRQLADLIGSPFDDRFYARASR